MPTKKLSKLQIRSEVLAILSEFASLDETPKERQDEIIKNLKVIENKEDLTDFLIKELAKTNGNKAQIITYILIEIGTLELLKEPLWAFVKDPKCTDEIKDLASVALRTLGDTSDTQEYLNYLNDPKAIIDKETQKLLEIAKVNPEAQIDFFDFLFSLPQNEQISLINSLKDDYSGENIINVLVPALETNPSDELKEIIIETLGLSKHEGAVAVLNDIYHNSKNEKFKKLAKKNINLLKLAGINIENNINDSRGETICNNTEIYECYASNVDGIGNQGIIISRIKPNQDIMMFTVVINDNEGIVDCFGFNGISKTDFSRIIHKFQEKSTRLLVSPAYCKYKLDEAEKISKQKNAFISYEYIAWKILINDFPTLENTIEETAQEWANINFTCQGEKLYNYPDFKYWFFEDTDNIEIHNFLERIIKETLNNIKNYKSNNEELLNWLDKEIKEILRFVFTDNLKKQYRKRLLNVSYLMNLQGLTAFRNIAASIGESLSSEKIPIDKNPFFVALMKKTISEGFLRYRKKIQDSQSNSQFLTSWNIKTLKKNEELLNSPCGENELCEIIDVLHDKWIEKE